MAKDEIYIEYIPLSKLQKWDRNPKDHDIGQIHQSIDRFGFISPIIIDEKSGKMIAGHGRVDTLLQKKEAGEKPPERIKKRKSDWLVPVVRGVSFDSEIEAEAYGIADNRLTELGGWIDAQLAEVLSDLASKDSMEGIGYDKNDLDSLISQMSIIGDYFDENNDNAEDSFHNRFKPNEGRVIAFGSFYYLLKGDIWTKEVQDLTVEFNVKASKEEKQNIAEKIGRLFLEELRQWEQAS